MSTTKELPNPLDPKNYSQVRFWTAKSFELYCDNLTGETDGLATQLKRRGPRRKSESHDDPHPYLENMDGSAVPRETLIKVGQKARRLWQTMSANGLAPSSWGKASETAYIYFNSEMLNEPEFHFFRYCEGNWKITRWATKAYASWARNHIRANEADNRRTPHANKRKRDPLDDPSLIQIDDDKDDNNAITALPDSSLFEDNATILAPLEPSASSSVHTQVCSIIH